NGLEVRVHTRAQLLVAHQLPVRLAEVERADVADGEQRVRARLRRVAEDARVQVEVEVRLGLVDVARAATGDRLELDELEPDLRREGLRGRVELLGRKGCQAPLVVGDLPHAANSLLRCPLPTQTDAPAKPARPETGVDERRLTPCTS